MKVRCGERDVAQARNPKDIAIGFLFRHFETSLFAIQNRFLSIGEVIPITPNFWNMLPPTFWPLMTAYAAVFLKQLVTLQFFVADRIFSPRKYRSNRALGVKSDRS